MADNPRLQVSLSTPWSERFIETFTLWQRLERHAPLCYGALAAAGLASGGC
jgi:hypothetical protein